MAQKRSRCDRLRCFRFARWAATWTQPPSLLEIAAFLESSFRTARSYRDDWINSTFPKQPHSRQDRND